MARLENPNLVIPDDLGPGQMLNFLTEAEEALAEDRLDPELKGYLLQLLRHLQGMTKDALAFVEEMDGAVASLSFANRASKLLLRHELKTYVLMPPKEGARIMDRAHKALDARPPDPAGEGEDETMGEVARIGDRVARRPSW